jgi:hypothetical protein
MHLQQLQFEKKNYISGTATNQVASSENNFQTQNTTQKVEKSTLSSIDTKDSKIHYSEFTSVDLVPRVQNAYKKIYSPKCTFLRPTKMRKNKYKHKNLKTLASATCFD